MKPTTKKIGRWALAVVCIALGFTGAILPIVPAWLFWAVAAVLLSPEIPPFRRFLDWLQRRYPRLRPKIKKARDLVDDKKR